MNAIDKEKGGPIDSDRSGALLIQLYACFNLFRVHVLFEALDIESNLRRISLEDGANFRAGLGGRNARPSRGRSSRLGSWSAPIHGILKQHVVHLPKPSLQARRFRGASRRHRVLMHAQRELSKNDAQTVGVVVFHFQERRGEKSARRTLKIAELFQSDARIRGAANVCWLCSRLARRNFERRARL